MAFFAVSACVSFLLYTAVVFTLDERNDFPANTETGSHSVGLQTISSHLSVDSAWKRIVSVEEVCSVYPNRIRLLLAALDLSRRGLEAVQTAATRGDTVAACEALLAYYQKADHGNLLDQEPDERPEAELLLTARQLLGDTVTFSGITARVPKLAAGAWEWTYTGPKGDQEFGYSLNGHQYFLSLFQAWKLTGNEAYTKTFDRLIRDWIVHNPFPAEGDSIFIVLNSQGSKLDYRDIGEVRWRTLEAGNRLGVSWPRLFFGFQKSEAFTPAARLLMIAGLFGHAEYLKEYHKKGHNWTTMEMNGLALTGLTFPEFKNAEAWATYALNVMKEEIFRQVYPDGVQKEISTKTQWVALMRFESVADYFRKAGREIPDNYVARLEEMYAYLAYAMRPDGHQPLNNDSDHEDLRPRVLKAAKIFHRPDWVWIATNGKKGVRPQGLPSVVFPWAGIHVMRNGWNADAHWAFFDTGPFGTGHQHADKLHLSISAYGRDLLVDGGRYTHEDYFSFDPTIWRGYFRSSLSHNVILVDGKGQTGGALITDHPLKEGVDYLITPAFDYARGTFPAGFKDVSGKAEHSRAMVYVRNRFWIVVDEIVTDRPRTLEVLWHYAPSCTVRTEGGTCMSVDPGKGNLRIMPVGRTDFDLKLVKGQTQPVIQGWYSEAYGIKVPNSTAVFSTKIANSEIFAWLLIPAKDKFTKVSAELLDKTNDDVRILIRERGEKPIEVTVPLRQRAPEIK
jgi:hypothetical protein